MTPHRIGIYIICGTFKPKFATRRLVCIFQSMINRLPGLVRLRRVLRHLLLNQSDPIGCHRTLSESTLGSGFTFFCRVPIRTRFPTHTWVRLTEGRGEIVEQHAARGYPRTLIHDGRFHFRYYGPSMRLARGQILVALALLWRLSSCRTTRGCPSNLEASPFSRFHSRYIGCAGGSTHGTTVVPLVVGVQVLPTTCGNPAYLSFPWTDLYASFSPVTTTSLLVVLSCTQERLRRIRRRSDIM